MPGEYSELLANCISTDNFRNKIDFSYVAREE